MRLARLVVALLFPLLVAVAQAQSVRWEAADQGAVSSTLQLVFEDCAPDGQPDLPSVPGISFTYVGQSESMNIVNFQMTRSVALTYMVRARQNTPIQIPAFTVKTTKGSMRVAAFNAAAPATSIDAVASAKLIPERTSVWAGEVFGLTYELTASRRNNPQISPTFEWNPAPLVAEDWSKPEVTEAVNGGERRVNVVFRSRAIAKAANPVKLEAATHLLSIQTGTIGFGIISQPRMEPVSVTSDQPTIEVKPLPAAPAGFTGAVGQFKLASKIVPERAAVGEPITWTLELSGTGNWPDLDGLPARNVSNDFQVVQPKAKRTPAEGKLFDVTLAEDVVLVPTKTGTYSLGPVTFTYFDPKAGAYKTVTAPRTNVTVGAPAAGQFNVTPPVTATTSSSEPAPRATVAPKAATPPAAIPRDPLPGRADAAAPMTRRTLIAWTLAPFGVLAGFWIGLALRRARATDPLRTRRDARNRIHTTLANLQNSPAAERTALLLAWQRDTAMLWELPHAAPRSSSLPDPAWARLWSEADRALYGANTALPPDWTARAQEAVGAKRIRGFQPWRLFLPQNLMPFAAAVAVLFTVSAAWVYGAEADASDAYRKGEFAAAEKAWRARLAESPRDWIARHNLSLALAQQERPAESAAQAAAAFVQQPNAPAARWNFTHASEKAGVASATLGAFYNPGPRQALASLASPAVWQRGVIAGAFLAAGALGWMLSNAYGARRRRTLWSAVTLLALALAAGGTAAAGVVTYGLAARPEAIIVARAGVLRSIPTEADTTQKSTPLAAGTLALADRTFLGWIRLAFDNGQTGWVRKDDVVPLWK